MGNRTERESYDADEIYALVCRRSPEALRGVQKILKSNPQLMNMLHQGKTLLDEPCRTGNAQMVSKLLELGILVHIPNKYGRSPIMTATIYGNYEVVKVLCQNGATIDNVYIRQTMSLLDLAIYRGFYEIAAYLYERVANKKIEEIQYYQQLAKRYYSRYVNYPIFIDGLKNGIDVAKLQDFLTKKREQSPQTKSTRYICCCDIFRTQKRESLKEKVNNYRQSVQIEKIINSENNLDCRSSKSSEVDTANAVDNHAGTDRNLFVTFGHSNSQQSK